MFDLEGRSLNAKRVHAAKQIHNANMHAKAVRDQDLAENDTVIPIKLSNHGRVFFTNWMDPSNL
jgi:hypothetical protein